MHPLLAELQARLEDAASPSVNSNPDIWVAYSGGLDSCVLLHALKQLEVQQSPALSGRLVRAVHINHQLQPEAEHWQHHCANQCEQWGVPFSACIVQLDLEAGLGIEAAARQARYEAFEQLIGSSDLLSAHHLDDQAETLLLRLMRSSGLRGLVGMPSVRTLGRGRLLRPLLAVRRATLRDYALRHRLQWIDDPSNEDVSFDRNYLRAEIMPRLSQRWSQAPALIAQSADHLRADGVLLDRLLAEKLALVADHSAEGTREAASPSKLDIASLNAQDAPLRAAILRYWLAGRQCFPSEKALSALVSMLATSEDNSLRWHYGGLELRSWRGTLYALNTDQLPQLTAAEEPPPQSWNPTTSIEWAGAPLRCDWHENGLASPDLPRLSGEKLGNPARLQWRCRRGGERCRLPGREHSHRLKHVLQQSDVPPWWRQWQPLLMNGEEVIAAPGVMVAQHYLAKPEEPGWSLHWDWD